MYITEYYTYNNEILHIIFWNIIYNINFKIYITANIISKKDLSLFSLFNKQIYENTPKCS